MYKKLNDLQFVIGLFFTVVSVILLLNVMLTNNVAGKLNTLTGAGFLVFGVGMMFIRKGNKA
jgi:multisubunit Na+/H+ antiporter MnhG subunit